MDFGMTVLYSLIQDALAQQAGPKQVPAEVIKEIVLDYHQRVGRVVGEQWHLPSAVIEAMAYHHCIEESGSDNPYIAVAALTDFLTNFVLSTPRNKLDEDIAGFAPEWLASNLSARFLDLNTQGAAATLEELPQHLDQALKFVID
jgi:HD-like signal output (HDOD) protein